MLNNKKILIGITGGIAVYKVCSLINKLKKEKAIDKVIMTESATKFVSQLTFQSLLGEPVYLDMFNSIGKEGVEHIKLADWCDVFVLAPATYNSINKICCGLADNLLTTTIAALPDKIPVLIVPAMNCHMWENKILQDNIKKINLIKINAKLNKYNFVGPDNGKLACGYEGYGKISGNDEIIKKISDLL